MLDADVPLIRHGRPVIRVRHMNADASETSGRRRGDVLHGASRTGRAKAGETLIERDLVCRNRSVGTGARLVHKVDVPGSVGRQAIIFTRAFLETRPAEPRGSRSSRPMES